MHCSQLVQFVCSPPGGEGLGLRLVCVFLLVRPRDTCGIILYTKLQLYAHLSVCLLWKVSRNDLTSTCKRPHLQQLSVRSQNQVISVNGSHDTNYRHEYQLFGWTIQKTGNNVHLHVVACSQLGSSIDGKILSQSLSWTQLVDYVSGVLPSHVSQERW